MNDLKAIGIRLLLRRSLSLGLLALFLGLLPLVSSCGHKLGYRHFSGPVLPQGDPDQANEFVVGDDRSITFVKDRLEVMLLPMTVDMLNRQLSNSGEHMSLGRQRVNALPDVQRIQQMMTELMAAHSKEAMQAKMLLFQCMLFNGLANFYDLHPGGSSEAFVDTLCGSIVAVLMEAAAARPTS